MKKSTKICLIVAAACIAVGILLTVIGFVVGGRGIVVLSNGKMEYCHDMETGVSPEYDDISNIKVDVYNYRVEIVDSNNDKVKCEYSFSTDTEKPDVTANNNTLEVKDNRKVIGSWFNFNIFNWNDQVPTLTIYLPKDAKLDTIDLLTRNGAVQIDNQLTVNNAKIKSSNGRITISNMTCLKQASMNTSDGRIECNGEFKGENDFVSSNGKIICQGNYEGDTKLDTSNGRIEFTGTFAGRLNCETSNGSIEVNSKTVRKQCNIDAKTSNGSVHIDDDKVSDSFSENNVADNNMRLKTSNGSIRANFAK